MTAADAPLLEAARRVPGSRVPGDDAVIVIHREPSGAGELAWMPDDRTSCLAVIRDARASTTCEPLPASWARIGIRLVTKATTYAARPGGADARTVFFAVVDAGHGPYGYSGSGTPRPELGPVRDATAVFASGRTLSLLTYERPAAAVSTGEYICSTDNAICFPPLDVYVG
ncbi:hypothetical protein [Streptomyces sp. NPDC054849]